MSRAKTDSLDELHRYVCALVHDELHRAEERSINHPDKPDMAVSPQLIDKAMKFLAMNGVTAPATSPRFDALKSVLEDLNLDEEAAHGRH